MAMPPQLILIWASVAEKVLPLLYRLRWWGKKKKKDEPKPTP